MRAAVVALALVVSVPVVLLPGKAALADAVRDQEWQLGFLRVIQAQRFSQGRGVVVAVVDSGVDATHPDLVGNVLAGTDVQIGATGDGQTDTDGHGTGMAGLIAAHGHGPGDSEGILGIAPQATILPVRDGARFGVAMADGIDWAVAHGARVISISQGDDTADTPVIRKAVENALAHDIVVVAGAGNTTSAIPQTSVSYPAAYPGVVAVAGVDRQGGHPTVSVTGPQVLLSAPAVDVPQTGLNHGYVTGTGTSAATAIVAGVVALVRARYPNLSATEVVHRLTATATDKGAPGRDEVYGYGIVNPVAALTANVPPLQQPTQSQTPSQKAEQPQPTKTSPWLFIAVGAVLLILATAGLVAIGRRRS
jgi:type VII secretion-associated serine protease mycosin